MGKMFKKRYKYAPDFMDIKKINIEKILNGDYDNIRSFYIDVSQKFYEYIPSDYTNIDIKNKFVLFDRSNIKHIIDPEAPHYHKEINDNNIQGLATLLNNPKIILESKDPNNSTSIVVIDDKLCNNGKQQVVALECNCSDFTNVVKVKSTYTKDSCENATSNFINQSNIIYLDDKLSLKQLSKWFNDNNIDIPSTSNCVTSEAKDTLDVLQDYNKHSDLSLYLYRDEEDKEPVIRNLYNLKVDNTIYTTDKFTKYEVRSSRDLENSTRLPEYEKKYSSLIKDTIDKANKYVESENIKFDGKTEEEINKINEHLASKEALQSISESLEVKNKINSKKFTK